MKKKKLRSARPWWRRRRTLQSLALLTSTVVVVGLIVWLLARGGGGGSSGPKQYLKEPAPPFTLPTIAGEQVSSADHRGRHNVLMFFNEGLGCSPCFDQIVDLEKDWDRFKALDLELVSIMVDPKDQLAAEVRRYGITSVVAVDADKSVSEAYDVMGASMHPGAKPGHSFVLVGKAGQIVWRRDWGFEDVGMMYSEVDEIYKSVSEWLERAGG